MRGWLVALVAVLLLVVAGFVLSPWPGVQVIRVIFDKGAAEASRGLEPLVPAEVTTETVRYDPADEEALLDLYRGPDAGGPVIVWVHGGGFVSGQRADVANYLKILAGRGFVVANVDYRIAPGATYPGPVRQLNAAMEFLDRERAQLGLGDAEFVLAGDSAGAQIAAQTAALAANAGYAARVGVLPGAWSDRLVGAILFCGVYDIAGMGRGGGVLGWFVETTGWAYSGTRDWRTSEDFATIDFVPHLTDAFPPAFISAGNADPLGPQSIALAVALEEADVPVETLFFPPDHEPRLGHEYQFNLASDDGRLAFERMTVWLRGL